MFYNYSHKYNPFLVFHKDMSSGSIHNKQMIFKVNNKSTKKKCKGLQKDNQNIQTTWDTLLWYPFCKTDICVQSCRSINI